jgi:hypothetical protein
MLTGMDLESKMAIGLEVQSGRSMESLKGQRVENHFLHKRNKLH